MNIKELMEEANAELLQEAWDKHLVDSYPKYADASMSDVMKVFSKKNKCPLQDVWQLKRTARAFQSKIKLSRFIGGYLPQLMSAICDSGKTKEEIAAWLSRQTFDTPNNPIDHSKAQRERREHSAANKAAMAESKSHYLVRKQREGNSRSNWSACK